MDDRIAEAADALRIEHDTKVDIEDRTIVVREPVKGDPGLTVLRVLGAAQAASLVGAAAHGENGVSVGVWRAPELYLARWPKGRRWVVGYRLTGGSRLSDYVGIEGRVPTRLETGHWYGPLPEEIADLFLEAGILVDDPPFPVPAPPAPAPGPVPRRAPGPSRPPAQRSGSVSPRPRAEASKAAPTSRVRPAAPTTRLCAGCRMHKAAGQFVPGSDVCIDCRTA
jgi:hypothetical protein